MADNETSIGDALPQLQPPIVHVSPAALIGELTVQLAGRDEQIRLLLEQLTRARRDLLAARFEQAKTE